jgi:hypothetical protein
MLAPTPAAAPTDLEAVKHDLAAAREKLAAVLSDARGALKRAEALAERQVTTELQPTEPFTAQYRR